MSVGSQDENPTAMPLLLGHSSLPTAAELSPSHGAKIVTWCLSGKYVRYAMVIFIHGGHASPFLDGDGWMIPFWSGCVLFRILIFMENMLKARPRTRAHQGTGSQLISEDTGDWTQNYF